MWNGTMHIIHGYKEIEFTPSNAPTKGGLIVYPGYYIDLNIKSFSNALLKLTDDRDALPKMVRNATGNQQKNVGEGFGNTFRHQAWQSLLTMALGEDIAKRAGNYHEADGIINTQNGSFIKDNIIDLLNNEYGRDYGKGFKFSDVTKDINSFTDYLNSLVRHLTSTVDGYKNDPDYDNLRSGKVNLFDPKDKNVQEIYKTASSLNDYCP